MNLILPLNSSSWKRQFSVWWYVWKRAVQMSSSPMWYSGNTVHLFSWSPCCHWGALKHFLSNKWVGGGGGCGGESGGGGRWSSLSSYFPFLLIWNALEHTFGFRLRCQVYLGQRCWHIPTWACGGPVCPHILPISQGCSCIYNIHP